MEKAEAEVEVEVEVEFQFSSRRHLIPNHAEQKVSSRSSSTLRKFR